MFCNKKLRKKEEDDVNEQVESLARTVEKPKDTYAASTNFKGTNFNVFSFRQVVVLL